MQVIHDGLNCKQYQENAKNEEGNPDSNTTKLMLEEMVENGEAMFCPTCRVLALIYTNSSFFFPFKLMRNFGSSISAGGFDEKMGL